MIQVKNYRPCGYLRKPLMTWPGELLMPEVDCLPQQSQLRRTGRVWMRHPRMAQAAQGQALFEKRGIPCGADALRVLGHSWGKVRMMGGTKWDGDVLSAQCSPVLGLEPRTLGSGRLTLRTSWLTTIALDFLASVDDRVRERVGDV